MVPDQEAKTLFLRIDGQVQGVGFRQAACAQARQLNLSGWVRNTRDGGVQLLACGQPQALAQLCAWARQGPPTAAVSSVTALEPQPAFAAHLTTPFSIAKTVDV